MRKEKNETNNPTLQVSKITLQVSKIPLHKIFQYSNKRGDGIRIDLE